MGGRRPGEVVYTTFAREATRLCGPFRRPRRREPGMDCRLRADLAQIRCVGRTDDMLIYKAMNVFPTAIRESSSRGSPTSSDRRTDLERNGSTRFASDDPSRSRSRPGPTSRPAVSRVAQQVEAELRKPAAVRAAVAVVAPARCLDELQDTPVYVRDQSHRRADDNPTDLPGLKVDELRPRIRETELRDGVALSQAAAAAGQCSQPPDGSSNWTRLSLAIRFDDEVEGRRSHHELDRFFSAGADIRCLRTTTPTTSVFLSPTSKEVIMRPAALPQGLHRRINRSLHGRREWFF